MFSIRNLRSLLATSSQSLRRSVNPPARTYRPMLDRLEDRSLMATLHVDDDFTADDAAHRQFMTIQAAVNAAAAKDTIRVAPGSYEEAVTVAKQLTIVADVKGSDNGKHKGNDKGKHNGDDNGKHNGKQTGPAIVEIPLGGSFGFNLTANDIVIRGFLIEDSDDNGNAAGADGIVTNSATSGNQILNNTIVGTTMGLYLNSNGAHRTIVSGNVFDGNNQAGAASGNGIYSDQGLSNAQIVNNLFTGQTNASIILVGGGTLGPGQSNLVIRQNVMRNDAPLILANTTHSEISKNTSTNSVGSGIFLAGGSSDVTIKQNVLTGGAFTGINLRFDPTNYNVSTVNTNIRILDNVISGFGDAGIRLRDGTNHVTVQNNRVTRNGAIGGISLENADNNTVQKNTASSNAGDGIHLDALSTGNVVTKNTAQNNAGFDLHDDSVGSGTGGTANTWTKNKARTRSPSSLG